ncbi:MAG: P1 family peptidase [Deltaproteobacteria bacterium]|nr:P1 family peptidase [Deltaproteobacteria bacterium]
MHNAITDVEGIRVGHAQDFSAATGCTVVLCEEGAVAGAYIGGSAAGIRQVEALMPLHLVEQAHAVLLSGGSAFGLDAASGVMRYLEERGNGLQIFNSCVPIVPTAVIFDLSLKTGKRRPDPEMGYTACMEAKAGPVDQGSIGVGTGATAGKLFGIQQAMKGGVGTAGCKAGKLVVGALVVTNPYGDVLDPESGRVLSGLRAAPDSLVVAGSARTMVECLSSAEGTNHSLANTTLAVVATNAALDKKQAIKLSQMAQNGLARVISPFHTMYDGDVTFALATGIVKASINAIGVLAEAAVIQAARNSVIHADGMGLLPAYRDMKVGTWTPETGRERKL